MKGIILQADRSILISSRQIFYKNIIELRDDVSTDEIYPVKFCFAYKDIGRYLLAGDKFGLIKKDFFIKRNIKFLVAGENFGCGSSREHAAIAFKDAEIKLIFANSFNQTFRSNCLNVGVFTTSFITTFKKYLTSGKIPKKLIAEEFFDIEKEKVKHGNLILFNKKQIHYQKKKKQHLTLKRPMTIAEKIISRHLSKQNYVKPGDQLYIKPDLRFSYEVFSPLIYDILNRSKINLALIKDPESIFLFEDHFILSDRRQFCQLLLDKQKEFASLVGAKQFLFGGQESGICHTVLVENYVMPGSFVVGTDSHTSTSGVVNALCLSVGATEMSSAIANRYVFVKVPHTVHIDVRGKLKSNVMVKDVMLHFLSQKNDLVGTVLEFCGEGLNVLPLDEQAVFTNMSTEAGAWTGIIEPNETMKKFIATNRENSFEFVYPDKEAEYKYKLEIDLTNIEPMIALPGSPVNAVPLSVVEAQKIKINKALIGSCTGGKLEDLVRAASVLKGKKIKKTVGLYIYPASKKIYQQAEKMGLIEIFRQAGAIICPSVCGACCGEGPGKVRKGEKIISASNRNFKGRMGAGDAYLANPKVVAASAIKGYITST